MTRKLVRFTGRQVNLALEALLIAAILSGLLSWSLGDRWNAAMTFAHGVSGIALALLVPAKLGGPVRTGFQRRRATRWISAVFGIQVIATLAFGLVHATGIWYGVGHWSALWTHELLAFSLIPVLVWHIASRPTRRSAATPRDRRAFLTFGAITATAAVLHITQRHAADAVGLAGGSRRGTGSHEIASHQPERMPTVIWLNDATPATTDPDDWSLLVDNAVISVASLMDQAVLIVATLDCTGGWWSEQSWDAVPLSALIPTPVGRSVYVESATGYSRRFPIGSIEHLYLAVGYGGTPLKRGHGAPVRLVVPGRRGPEWIKWVTKVHCSDRPPWLQLPLPLS